MYPKKEEEILMEGIMRTRANTKKSCESHVNHSSADQDSLEMWQFNMEKIGSCK